jgi:hypothetical protein
VKAAAAFLLSLVMSAAGVYAMGIAVNPAEVWIGDAIEITCITEDLGFPQNVFAEISSPIFQRLDSFSTTDNKIYTYSNSGPYRPPVKGSYTIHCSNGTADSPPSHFNVSRMHLEITDFGRSIFEGDKITLSALPLKETASNETILSNILFSVFAAGEPQEIEELPYYDFSSGAWIITTAPVSLPPGKYPLVLNASYSGESASASETVEIKPVYEFGMSLSETAAIPGQTIAAAITATKYGKPVFTPEFLQLEMDGQSLEFEDEGGIVFSLPSVEAGEHNITATFSFEGMLFSASQTVTILIPFSGAAEKADGSPARGQMEFFRQGNTTSVSIEADGRYSFALSRGTYDLEFSMEGMKSNFGSVEVERELENFFSYDRFDGMQIPGFSVISGFAFSLGFPFQEATFALPYKPSAVMDENSLEVFACKDWNFAQRKCSGEWEKVPSMIDSTQNEATFSFAPPAGFVLGYRKSLKIQASVFNELGHAESRFSPGSAVRVEGTVDDNEGNRIEKVLVTYSVSGIRGSVETDSKGIFSFEFLPPEEGNLEISLEAAREPYEKAEKTIPITVKKKKELALILPENAEAVKGKQKIFEIRAVNTGETAFSNLAISISGIPPAWYSVTPQERKVLLPRGEATFFLDLTAGEEKVLLVNVNISAGEIQKSGIFTLKIINASSPPKPPGGLEYISGLFTSEGFPDTLNMASLMLSFFIAFLIFRKIRKRPGAETAETVRLLKSEVMGNSSRAGARKKRKKRKRPSLPDYAPEMI